jgi:glycosylphosphatidylinositol phospholipase D
MQPVLSFQIPTAVSSSSISIFAAPRQFKSSLFLFGTNSPTSSTILQNVELPRNFIGNHFVVLGKKGAYKNLNLLDDSVPNVFSVSNGGVAQGTMTRSISNIGDINRDGIDDYIFGDPLADRCYVYLPEAGSNLMNMKISFMIMPEIGTTKKIGLGWATAGIGDFNHDNYNDFIITAPTINTAYIIYGRSRRRFPNPLILSMLSSQTGMVIAGNTGTDRNFGMAVSSAGDFNGDGFVDILISATRASSSSQSNVYVILGEKAIYQKNMTVMLNSQSSLQYVQITTPRSSFSGMSISGIGDFNGDGLDDVAVGSAPYQSVDAQSTFIVYGRSVLATTPIQIDVSSMKEEDGVVLTGGGFMVSGLGDVNGDGLGDLMVSSYSGWLGKGNAYLTVYPNNITSSPSFSPTSMPSTVFPSSIPTMMSSPSSFPSLPPSRYIPPSGSISPSIAKTSRPIVTSCPSSIPTMKLHSLRPHVPHFGHLKQSFHRKSQ